MSLEIAYRILILTIFGISEENPEASDLSPIREKDIELINSILAGLSPLEQKVIEMRYCLDGNLEKPTLEKVGQEIGGIIKKKVTRERARQIEKGVLRKLRHSSRIFLLKKLFRTELEERLAALEKELKQINEVKKKEKSPDVIFIDGINLSRRTRNCLRKAGILNLQELADCPASKLLGFRNFGQKSLKEVEELLARYGLGFSGRNPAAVSCE